MVEELFTLFIFLFDFLKIHFFLLNLTNRKRGKAFKIHVMRSVCYCIKLKTELLLGKWKTFYIDPAK